MKCYNKMKSFNAATTVIIVIVSVLIWSTNSQPEHGPGLGIYETLRGYAGELGNVLKEVSSGVQKLAHQVKSFEEFLDATVDEDCNFECPPGQIAKSRPGHKPVTNGCGAYGLEQFLTPEMLPVTGFVECCDQHDICYETCGEDKDECDLKFKKCLYKKCAVLKNADSAAIQKKISVVGCKAGAKLLYTGTTAVGCKPYLNAQQNACFCKPIKDEF
ncbi:Group XIIB secretory phospholipase A2-like protein [Orchesella cincta]|uniref:Group XIIB secretory phospholipase A2-like protein n=1 Tax=Orchesella cincta TaxID=48709 RepID=A0A1D2M5P8_ORCCI|nr:Group XIIB secretory phospholipase A2-like protein [Orchesella cincta]